MYWTRVWTWTRFSLPLIMNLIQFQTPNILLKRSTFRFCNLSRPEVGLVTGPVTYSLAVQTPSPFPVSQSFVPYQHDDNLAWKSMRRRFSKFQPLCVVWLLGQAGRPGIYRRLAAARRAPRHRMHSARRRNEGAAARAAPLCTPPASFRPKIARR